MLRLRLLLDEDVSGFVGVAILGVKGSYGWGCFRPIAAVGDTQKSTRSSLCLTGGSLVGQGVCILMACVQRCSEIPNWEMDATWTTQ